MIEEEKLKEEEIQLKRKRRTKEEMALAKEKRA